MNAFNFNIVSTILVAKFRIKLAKKIAVLDYKIDIGNDET